MKSVMRIAGWELLILQRSGVGLAAMLMALLFSLLAIFQGVERTRQERASVQRFKESDESRLAVYQKRAAIMEQQLANGGNGPIPQYEFAWGLRKPLWPTAWAPLSAVPPPVPLGALTRGQTELQRSAFAGWTLTPSAQSTENPLSLLAGSFDFTFVVLAVFPLLAIALAWDLLSGEGETGTLGLLLSHPVSMGQIVCGKLLARAATLFVPYDSVLMVAAVVAVPPEPGSFGRFAIHSLAGAAYILVWLLIGASTNLLLRRSGATAVTLAFTWVTLTLLVPSSMDRVASWLHPIPSRVSYVDAKRQIEAASAQLSEPEALKVFLGRHPWLVPADQYTGEGRRFLVNYARREKRDSDMAALDARYEDARHNHHRLARRLSFLSPAVALRLAHEESAGAGDSRYGHFLRQTKEFQTQSRRFFFPRIFRGLEFSSADYEKIPRFAYVEQPWSEGVRQAATGLGALAIWLFGTTTVVCITAIRRPR